MNLIFYWLARAEGALEAWLQRAEGPRDRRAWVAFCRAWMAESEAKEKERG